MPISVDEVVNATGCPRNNVDAYWPIIQNALDTGGIFTPEVEIAAAATVAVETGIFKPLKEKKADPGRQPALWALQSRYYDTGFCGRGFIQLTWKENYEKYSQLVGIDLVSNPDILLVPTVSAMVLTAFFKENHVHIAADEKDWRKVRKIVNGGLMGWDYFSKVVCKLNV